MDRTKIIATAQKLKALMIQGEGGERENSRIALENLYRSYQWLRNEIEIGEDRTKYRYDLKSIKFEQIAAQLAFKHDLETYHFPGAKGAKLTRQVEGPRMAVERFKAEWPIHERAYAKTVKETKERHNKEMAVLSSAYVQANKLFRPNGKTNTELTPEDWEIIRAAQKMTPTQVLPQLRK